MDSTRKIVFVVFAIYLVLGLQFFFEYGSFIIPVVFNPIVLLLVSIIAVISSHKRIAFNTNVVYMTGLLIYAMLSERTLNIGFNYSNFAWIPELMDNPLTRLVEICFYFFMLLGLTIYYTVGNKKGLMALCLLVPSIVAGLLNQQLFYVIGFTLYGIVFLFVNVFSKDETSKIQFSGITYQLILFILLENCFIFLN